jgi:hypothetical protein
MHVTPDDQVLVTWSDGFTSGTLRLTPSQAQAIGDMGALAKERAAQQPEG